MSNHIPADLKLPVKYNVFNLHYQRIQALIIDKHTKRIQKLCHKSDSKLLDKLSSALFWTELKQKSKNSSQVNELHEQWLKLKPLAHLSSKQLISLYQDDIVSLERGYQYLIAQFPEEAIKSQLTNNLKRLEALKQHVLEGLRYRAQVHSILRSARNTDDVLASFCVKINELKVLGTPLEAPSQISATLDDDRRLFIFDLLKMAKINKKDLHKEILSPIPKRGHSPLRTPEAIKNELDKFNQYRNEVIKGLSLKGVGSYVYAATASSKAKGVKALWREFYENFKEFLNKLWESPFAENFSYIKFFIYLSISFSSYHFLIKALEPIALLLVNVGTFSMISSLLFYTMALAPVWWLGYQVGKASYSFIHDYVSCWKKKEILDALVTLEDSEHFLCEKLSQIIIDIPHFDIKDLNKRAIEFESELNKAEINLERYATGEKFVCGKAIQKEAKKAKKKIESVKDKLKKGLALLASHIASRVGEDIELLDKAVDANKMQPILPKKQLSYLEEFVNRVGDEKARALFDRNANIVKKWYEKIQADRFSYEDPNSKGKYQQPWGGSQIRTDSLKGWKVILEAFSKDPIQKDALLKLHSLLRGKKTLSSEEMKEVINALSEGDDKNAILETVQDFIFKTLQDRSPEYASLLSSSQKKLISHWYNQNKREIEQANAKVKQLFSSNKLNITQLNALLEKMSVKELSKYFELLDGEDIYNYSVGKIQSLKDRHNLVRQFFEKYEGNTSHAYRLIAFVPKVEQPALVTEFAYKRLDWFLANLKRGVNLRAPFDEYDTALFHNSDLHLFGEFDFTAFVLGSDYFNEPWSQEMETFLDACQKNGLDSGGLLSKFLEKKEMFNPFLVKRGAKASSCGSDEKIIPESKNTAGGIRV